MFSRLFESSRGVQEGPSELPVGMKLEVLRYNGELRFIGKLEWAKNGTYQITSEDDSPLPPVEYNSTVSLRSSYRGEVLFVEGKVVGSSAQMWRIEQNKVVRGADQRAYFRQNVKIPVNLCCSNDMRGEECGEETPRGVMFPATMLNLSAGGAQFITTANFGEKDWVSALSVELVPEMEPFSFVCAIRRKTDPDGRGKQWIYGCEFLDLGAGEQDRLIKAILALQRKEIRSRRGG